MCAHFSVIFLISTGSLVDLFTSTSLSLEDRVMFLGKREEQKKQSLCDPKKLVRKIKKLS